MDLVWIGAVAFLASGLTFVSGFGLGTLLMPVFALFFPVPLAIAATAIVHFANNLFKLWLMAGAASWRVVARFGLPAVAAALLGAAVLATFDRLPVLATYDLGGNEHRITAIKAVIGLLIVVFALLEMWPRFQALAIPPRWLPLGGVLSGFFGGLSGNQGALRSAFLVKAGLSKEAFIATGIVCAVLVDATRLVVYGLGPDAAGLATPGLAAPVVVATASALLGAVLGKRLLHKITLRTVQLVVAAFMLVVGTGLALGLI
jgi:uncharacterized membrane protein YfcA